MDSNELKHYGVLGMKWGRRRYQNKDGTLTNAGKKRYDKEMAKLKKEATILKNKQRTAAKIEKLNAKQREVDELRGKTSVKDKTSKKKSIKDLSNEELKERIDRLDLEKRYRDAIANKERIDAGKNATSNAMKRIGGEIVADMGKQVGKHFAAKLINKLLNEEAVYANNKKK